MRHGMWSSQSQTHCVAEDEELLIILTLHTCSSQEKNIFLEDIHLWQGMWCTLLIPELQRLGQGHISVIQGQARQSYIVRPQL